MSRRTDENRNATIIALYRGGALQHEIAKISGISRQRVSQVLNMNGVGKADGYHSVDALKVIAACRRPGVRSWNKAAKSVDLPRGADAKAVAAELGLERAIARLFAWRSGHRRRTQIERQRTHYLREYGALRERLGRIPKQIDLCPRNGVPFWTEWYRWFPGMIALKAAAGVDTTDGRTIANRRRIGTRNRRRYA